MNSIAQHAVPNGMGHNEFARPQFTRNSRRVVTQPSCDGGSYVTLDDAVAGLNPIAMLPCATRT